MATHVLPILPDTDDEIPLFSGERHAYTHGGCGYFALALHKITGWRMVAYDANSETYLHMGVVAPDGNVWDARGQHKILATFIHPFGTTIPRLGLRAVTVEQLIADHPKYEFWLNIGAERYASMMFPELPHLQSCDRSKNVAFMDAVEDCSRRHSLWIIPCNGSMHTWPIIGEEFEGITGYRATSNNGSTFMDRALLSDAAITQEHPRVVTRFVQELAEISRKHRLWIRSSYPTARPMLHKLDDYSAVDARYAIQQTLNAAGFVVSLKLT